MDVEGPEDKESVTSNATLPYDSGHVLKKFRNRGGGGGGGEGREGVEGC